jgi:hypothetical protein
MELNSLEDFIEKNYSLEALRKLYKNFISQIITYDGDVKLETKELNFSLQKIQKKEISKLLAKIFYNKKLFNDLLNILPEETIKVFKLLVWEKSKFKVNEIEKILNLEDKILLNATKNKPIELNNQYNFFCLERINNNSILSYDYKIYIPEEIRNHIKDFFEPPEDIILKPVEKIEETNFKNINSNNVIKSIHLYFNYINNNKIDLTKERPSKAVLRNIKDYCEISEFFENREEKDLEYLKTEIFHTYLKDIDIQLDLNLDDLLKTVFNYFQYYSLDLLLFHIKGKNFLKENEYFINKSKEFKSLFLKVFSELPYNQWIDFNNFKKSLYYRDIPMLISKDILDSNLIYFDELKKASSYSYSQKTFLNEENYNDIFLIPLIKGIIFLFSSIGLLDIAYNLPKNSVYLQKNQDYLTVFDELKYIKLNDIGANVLGLNSNLDYKIDEDIKIELDQDYLIIRVSKEDKIKCSFIESISKKVKEKTYLVTKESFIANCNNIEDVLSKIKFFYQEINSSPGYIWEQFFNNLKSRIININKIENIEVFQIPNDKNLLRILFENDSLSDLFYKVEDLKIAIPKENIQIFFKKLFEVGIFVNVI